MAKQMIIIAIIEKRNIRPMKSGPPWRIGTLSPSPPPVSEAHDEATSRSTSTIAREPIAK